MAHTWMFFSTLFFSLPIVCTAQDTSDSKPLQPTLARLNEHLMKGYKKGMRPVYDWRKTTVVQIDMVVYAILGVSEKDQLLKTYMWLKQSWKDEFLTWDPKDFDNVTKITIPGQLIWIPDIIVLEFVESTRSPETPYVYVYNTGRVVNPKPLLITTTCSLNIFYFPFDTQRCSVSFTSWLHNGIGVNIDAGILVYHIAINTLQGFHVQKTLAHAVCRSSPAITLLVEDTIQSQEINVTSMDQEAQIADFHSIYMNDGEWDLVNLIKRFTVLENRVTNLGELEFILVIRRKPLFYAMTMIIPSLLLMIMDVAGFYLPPESGERISFKITLLLGYSVFLIIISDTLPAVGTPLIGSYYTICMVLLVVSLIESIFIVRMVHQQNIHKQVPGWVKTLVLEKMIAFLFIKDMVRNYRSACSQKIDSGNTVVLPYCKNYDSEDNKGTSIEALPIMENMKLLSSILKEVASIRQHINKTCDENGANEWLLVGHILDVFLFRIYYSIIIMFILTLTIMWSFA